MRYNEIPLETTKAFSSAVEFYTCAIHDSYQFSEHTTRQYFRQFVGEIRYIKNTYPRYMGS